MARVFAHPIEMGAEITDQAILPSPRASLGSVRARTHQENPQATGIAQRLFEMALQRLV